MLNIRKIDLCNLLSSSDTGLNDSLVRQLVSRMYASARIKRERERQKYEEKILLFSFQHTHTPSDATAR